MKVNNFIFPFLLIQFQHLNETIIHEVPITTDVHFSEVYQFTKIYGRKTLKVTKKQSF